jgi:hypothetical protein
MRRGPPYHSVGLGSEAGPNASRTMLTLGLTVVKDRIRSSLNRPFRASETVVIAESGSDRGTPRG